MMRRLNATICIYALVLALTGIGLLMVYSSSSVVAASRVNKMRSSNLPLGETFHPVSHHWLYLRKQMVWCGLGLVFMLLLYSADYNTILKRSKLLCLAAFLLLLCVYIPGIGVKIHHVRRWIRLGPFTFQPSEFAKLALVIATAKILNDRRKHLRSFFHGFFPALALASVFIVLIAIEDLGTAVVIALIMLVVWFIAGIRIVHLLSLVPPTLAVGVVAIFLKPWRLDRILIYLKWLFLGGVGAADIHKQAWQSWQSLIAVGTGGWSGLGLGMGIQKHHFLAEMYTDFIFANICEELGFIGAVGVVLLFAALCFMGFRVAYRSPDFVGSLLAAGTTAMITVPFLVNVAVVLNLVPTKGLALPFISYGGSSLVMNLSAIGILMNIARRNEQLLGVRRPVAVTPERRLWSWGRPARGY